MEAANPATNDSTTSKNGQSPANNNSQVVNKSLSTSQNNTRTTKNQPQNPPKARQERNGTNRSQYQPVQNQQYQQGQNNQNTNQTYDSGKAKNSRRGKKQYNQKEEQEGQTETQQKARGASNRSSRDPSVIYLRTQFNNYYSDEVLFKSLEQNNFNVERTLQQLQAQKEKSWSNIVVKSPATFTLPVDQPLPQPQVQIPHLAVEAHVQNHSQGQDYPPDNYQQRQKPQKHRKPQHNAPEPALPKEEEYNADEKIESILSALEMKLSAYLTGAEKLKRLQEDIRKIQADRDIKIEHLSVEKERLVHTSQQLRQEILAKDQRVTDIDVEVARLKQEKVQKLKLLEDECQTLLSDK